jgi:hypothetical protein
MKYSKDYARHVGMLAGGTGITPMLVRPLVPSGCAEVTRDYQQIIRAALKNPRDKTKISLIYANVTEKDILLRKDLDRISEESGGQFDVHYVLDKPPEGWKGATGYISKELIEEHMPKPAEGSHVLMCGACGFTLCGTALTSQDRTSADVRLLSSSCDRLLMCMHRIKGRLLRCKLSSRPVTLARSAKEVPRATQVRAAEPHLEAGRSDECCILCILRASLRSRTSSASSAGAKQTLG